jgi:hypothetical protein
VSEPGPARVELNETIYCVHIACYLVQSHPATKSRRFSVSSRNLLRVFGFLCLIRLDANTKTPETAEIIRNNLNSAALPRKLITIPSFCAQMPEHGGDDKNDFHNRPSRTRPSVVVGALE